MADGGQITLSPELRLLASIDRYGADSVMGRPLYHDEILRMNAAAAVVSAYNAKYAQKNWTEWADKNPAQDLLLNEAMVLAEQYGW